MWGTSSVLLRILSTLGDAMSSVDGVLEGTTNQAQVELIIEINE